jgi:peptidoglycan/LPS O-acetylase OafA/YrhL
MQTQATSLTAATIPPAKPGTAKRNHLASTHLDAVRGIAALLVLVSHVRAIFFVDTPNILVKGAYPKLFYFITGAGHSAVMVFFVLSGYFISSSVFRAIEKNGWSWKDYALNRMTRLYVVLIPALLLGAFWDCLGMHLFGTQGVYGGHRSQLPQPIFQRETLPIWLGNLFFLQEICVPPFGSNAALWSLSYEFWYYLLFPLCLLGMLRVTTLKTRVICLTSAVAILIFVGKAVVLYFSIWLMGAILSRLKSSSWTGHPAFVSICFFVLLLVFFLSKIINSRIWDYILAAVFSCAMYGLLNVRNHLGYALYRRTSHFFSGISYSLYLSHLPLILFLNALIVGNGLRWQPDMRHICLALLISVAVVGYACAVWWIAESRTDHVRSYLRSVLKQLLPAQLENA